MNERIRALAEQAGFENGHQDRNGNSLSCELEKFAELIIRDCAQVANDSNQSKNRAVGASVGDVIRNHFGVKE